MKQLILPLIGTMIFVVLIGLFVTNPGKYIKNQASESTQKIVKINETEILVDIADTSEERSRGLSKKESLNEKEGMLFVFTNNEESPIFWMKNMLISIDIIWINNGKIIQINKNVSPEKDTADDKLTKYTASSSVNYVLEVNSGFSDKYGLKVGDSVDFSQI